jgi:hypothetical protein
VTVPWTAAVVCLAVADAAAGEPPRPVAALVWRDLVGLPPAVATAARAEVDSLLESAGVGTDWLIATDDVPARYLPLVVMNRAPQSRALSDRTLGAARPHYGAWAFYPLLARLLAPRAGREHAPDAEELGRALGRVLAHEVVHALGAPERHADHGLMSARLGRDALLAARLECDAASQAALRSGLASVHAEVVDPDRALKARLDRAAVENEDEGTDLVEVEAAVGLGVDGAQARKGQRDRAPHR